MAVTARGLATGLALLPVLLLLAACADEGTRAVPSASATQDAVPVPDDVRRVLHVDVEGRAASPGEVVPTVRNAMDRSMAITVATAGGGRVLLAEGPGGAGQALRLPHYRPSGPLSAAVVVLRGTGRHDALAPGPRDFRFGARFRLDETSDGTDVDNGDNLVQRGLFADDVQYKLQVDGGLPSCVVRGDDGRVTVKALEKVQRRTWYDVACTRTGSGVALRVEPVDGTGQAVTVKSRGSTGLLRPARAVPLSIGGKVSEAGEVTLSAADQFNGLIDDVYLEYPR